jgi:predicted transcriptional regulator
MLPTCLVVMMISNKLSDVDVTPGTLDVGRLDSLRQELADLGRNRTKEELQEKRNQLTNLVSRIKTAEHQAKICRQKVQELKGEPTRIRIALRETGRNSL